MKAVGFILAMVAFMACMHIALAVSNKIHPKKPPRYRCTKNACKPIEFPKPLICPIMPKGTRKKPRDYNCKEA